MKTKPDWNIAPEWANYLAMDFSGAWYWYELKPTKSIMDRQWISTIGGRSELVELISWEDSLEERNL